MQKRQKYGGFLRKYHNVFLFLGILVFSGVIIGVLFSQFISNDDIQSLTNSINSVAGSNNSREIFVNEFFIGILFVLGVFFLGTSVIGVPFISFIAFTQGVQIGFSAALFISTYQLKGLLGIILTLLPQICFDLVSTFLISAAAIQLSIFLVYSCSNREKLNLKKLCNSFLNDLVICFIIVLISSFVKATLGIEGIKLFNLI